METRFYTNVGMNLNNPVEKIFRKLDRTGLLAGKGINIHVNILHKYFGQF